MLPLAEIAISACRDVISGRDSAEECQRKAWYPVWRKTWCSVSV